MRRRRGSALATLLLVLAVLLVFLAAVVALAAHHARLVHGNLQSVAAVQAAEAGIHTGLHRLSLDRAWEAGLPDLRLGGELDPRCALQVVNNLQGAAPRPGPGGLVVPPGQALLYSTGTCGEFRRRVVVFVSGGIRFGYAIATGGELVLNAAGTIQGSLKSSSSLVIDARLEVQPVEGQGRVLCGEDLTVKANLVLQPGQDVRARGEIAGQAKIQGASPIVAHDTTPDTDPFVMDGRITNDPPAGGEVMPNPDLSVLLADGSYVEHPGFTQYGGGNRSLDLGGQVHYFPGGVRFAPGSEITGEGVLVVGNGNSAVFDIPIDHHMDVVALDGQSGTVGGAEIHFNRSTRIEGLVYCHGTIYSNSDFRVDGRVIAYGDGQFVHTGAHAVAALNPAAVTCPGFEEFFGPASGPTGLGISSWQRL